MEHEPLVVVPKSLLDAAIRHMHTNRLHMEVLLGEESTRVREVAQQVYELNQTKEKQLGRHQLGASATRLEAQEQVLERRQQVLRRMLKRLG